MEIEAVAAAAGAIGKLIELAKKLGDLSKATDDAELRSVARELHSVIMDVREENFALRRRLEDAESTLRDVSGLTFRDNALHDEASGAGPFCSRCADVKHQKVHLHDLKNGCHKCPECECIVGRVRGPRQTQAIGTLGDPMP